MNESIKSISTVSSLGDIAENQAASTEEITAALEQITSTSQMLVNLSKLEN